MAYSTQTQLESNVEILEKTITNAVTRASFAAERIAFADNIVSIDLQKFIDFDLVPNITDDPATPVFINLLSIYKSAEMTLVRLSSSIRKNTEMHDITYWQSLYNALLENIKNGEITLELSDGTSIAIGGDRFLNSARRDISPFFGVGKYGTWIDTDDLEDLRDEDDDIAF